MSTSTVHRPLGSWFVWVATGLAALLVVSAVVLWLLPRWAPVWIATYSPSLDYALFALRSGSEEFDEGVDALSQRITDWHAAPVLRRRLEAQAGDTGLSLLDAWAELPLAATICDLEILRHAVPEQVPEAERERWALRHREAQRDDLLAIGLLALRSGHAMHRDFGLTILSDLADPRSVQALAAHLDTNPAATDTVARLLIGLDAKIALLSILRAIKRDPSLNPLSLLMLIDRVPGPVPAWVLIDLMGHSSAYVRQFALTRLGREPDPQVLAAVLMLVHAPQPRIAELARRHVPRVLARAAPEAVVDLLDHAQEQVRLGAAWALQQQPRPMAVPALLRHLVTAPEYVDPHLERALLACLPPDDDTLLLPALQADDATLRAWVVRLMGRRALPDSAAHLMGSLGDPQPPVQAAACRAVGDLRLVEAAPMVRGLVLHGEVRVRSAALRALGRVGDEQDVPILRAALADPEERVRVAAVLALGELGPPGARTDLDRLREDPADAVRAAVGLALGWPADAVPAPEADMPIGR